MYHVFKISVFDEKNVSHRLYGSLYGDLLVDIVVNYTYTYLVISKSPVFVEQHFEVIQLYITCFIRPTKTWLDLRRLDLRKSWCGDGTLNFSQRHGEKISLRCITSDLSMHKQRIWVNFIIIHEPEKFGEYWENSPYIFTIQCGCDVRSPANDQ